MIDPRVFIQEPLVFKNTIKIYPPTVREVVSNPNFNLYLKLLTITQEEIQEELAGKISPETQLPTPFEYLISHCQYTNGFEQLVKEALGFFCKTKVDFDYREQSIYLLTDENTACIQEIDFFDFQNQIRQACGVKVVAPPIPIDPDENPEIRRIKELARKRDAIKAKHQAEKGLSLSTCLVAICCMGIGITPLNIGELSYAAVGQLMSMMQEKEKYDMDIRSILAGADSKKIKPKYWIRNIDE